MGARSAVEGSGSVLVNIVLTHRRLPEPSMTIVYPVALISPHNKELITLGVKPGVWLRLVVARVTGGW